jgi:hypothetical protein
MQGFRACRERREILVDNNKELWNSQQKELRDFLSKKDKFHEAIKICLEQHLMVHSSEMSQANTTTFEDELWEGLEERIFRGKLTEKDDTIAWNLWHITRIEDITMNILVEGGTQVINTEGWLTKMNLKVCDTGNAMTNEEIIDFSISVNMEELKRYRVAVGRKTREIINGLTPSDLKRKMDPKRLERILDEGAVLEHEASKWLIKFWGNKNVAGILLMPATRHQIVHINDSMRIKEKYKKINDKKVK